MAKYQIDSIQKWDDFEHAGVTYSLAHLSVHEVEYKGQTAIYRFIVTYGLHCFAKDDTGFNIPFKYKDGREERFVCLERYEASKRLQTFILKLDQDHKIHQQEGERYFTLTAFNSAKGIEEPYKIALAIFKDNRLMRIHVTSAYFVREGEGTPEKPVKRPGYSIFKLAKDLYGKKGGNSYPKEVRNRAKP